MEVWVIEEIVDSNYVSLVWIAESEQQAKAWVAERPTWCFEFRITAETVGLPPTNWSDGPWSDKDFEEMQQQEAANA